MSRAFRLLVAGLVLALVAITQSPPPPPEPAVRLHRTAAASFFEPAAKPVLFVLIIGSDVREGDPRAGRADSLHLLAINTKKDAGTLIGIPRDSYVPIPGSGTDKINAALFFGGPGRVVDTVSRLAGVPIHYWALIDFSRFRRLVDALGGVVVDVPYVFADPASGAYFGPGPNKFNGEKALAFSRARKSVPGGDFGRSENQGRLLLAGLRQFGRDAASPLQLAKYLRAFRDHVEANIPTSELLDLATLGRRLDAGKVHNLVLPGGGGTAGGASVVHLSAGANEIFAKVRDDGLL